MLVVVVSVFGGTLFVVVISVLATLHLSHFPPLLCGFLQFILHLHLGVHGHDDGDSDCDESNGTSDEDDAMLPTQLATVNDRVDTDSENDSDSEHEED